MDQLFLDDRDFLQGNFHPHIAAGDHDAVRHLDDVVNILHPFRIFNFGDDADGVVVVFLQFLPDLEHVVRPAGKGSGDEFRFHLAGETDICPVTLTHERHGELRAGYVDPFVGRNHPAVNHGAKDFRRGRLFHPKLDEAVVNKDGPARLHIAREPGKADGRPLSASFHRLCGQDERIARFELHLFREGPQPDFRAFGVNEDGNGQVQFFPQLFHLVNPRKLVRVILMGHVDAGNVHAGEHQFPQDSGIVGGRAKGADDFCFPHSRQTMPFLKFSGFRRLDGMRAPARIGFGNKRVGSGKPFYNFRIFPSLYYITNPLKKEQKSFFSTGFSGIWIKRRGDLRKIRHILTHPSFPATACRG